MNETKLKVLAGRYLAALRTRFEQGPEMGLQAAHDFGSQAVAMGLETLDMAKIHRHALDALVSPGMATSKREVLINRAAMFFTEANTHIEMTHRAARVARADPNELHDTLIKRTEEPADSNRVFTAGRERSGLLGVKERVEKIDGTFGVESVSDAETTIRVHIPLGSIDTKKRTAN